eukprot:5524319-Pleurochrysis_carterae.AAC.1
MHDVRPPSLRLFAPCMRTYPVCANIQCMRARPFFMRARTVYARGHPAGRTPCAPGMHSCPFALRIMHARTQHACAAARTVRARTAAPVAPTRAHSIYTRRVTRRVTQ